MTIAKNILYKWKKEALMAKERIKSPLDGGEEDKVEWANRILVLIQELIDMRLLEEEMTNETLA